MYLNAAVPVIGDVDVIPGIVVGVDIRRGDAGEGVPGVLDNKWRRGP